MPPTPDVKYKYSKVVPVVFIATQILEPATCRTVLVAPDLLLEVQGGTTAKCEWDKVGDGAAEQEEYLAIQNSNSLLEGGKAWVSNQGTQDKKMS